MGASVALYHTSILESPSEYMHIEILILIFKAQNLLYTEVITNLISLFKLSISALAFYQPVPWPFYQPVPWPF